MAGRFRKLALGAGVAWLWWRHFGPELQPSYHGVQHRPSRLTGRTVVVGPHEFFVRESGPADGEPLVLLHGWVYDSLATWHRVLPFLGGHHRIIEIDHRNHGKSDRIRGRYDVDVAADEMAGVLQTLGVDGATVVGYSMGGMITLALARRHPAMVAKMVLAGTAAFPVPRHRLASRILFALGRGVGIFTPDVGARFSYYYLRRVGAVNVEHSRWLWEQLLDRDMNLYFQAGRVIWRFDARPWVGTLTVPALVIIPTEDQLVPPTAQYELASLLPGAEVVELVGARHEAVLTAAEDIAKAINRFAD